MAWKPLETLPFVEGKRLLFAGYYQGQWVSMTAYWGRFADQPFPYVSRSDDKFWIVGGHIMLDNFGVQWCYWDYVDGPPKMLEE